MVRRSWFDNLTMTLTKEGYSECLRPASAEPVVAAAQRPAPGLLFRVNPYTNEA
jgi:hypothetical protein